MPFEQAGYASYVALRQLVKAAGVWRGESLPQNMINLESMALCCTMG